MKIKAPKYIFVLNDGEKFEYRLFVDYAKALDDGKWKWKITYVGDHGILFMEINETLHELETKVFDFIHDNNYEFD